MTYIMLIEVKMRPKMEQKGKHSVRTLSKKTQVIQNFCGAYDMLEGYVELGCDEDHCATIIWHEVIHKLLFECICLEATIMWDNIADDLQFYLFDIPKQKHPYIFSQPPTKAKEQDGGAWREGKRKQKEKSERTGWKPSTTKRIPVRTHKDIIDRMSLY